MTVSSNQLIYLFVFLFVYIVFFSQYCLIHALVRIMLQNSSDELAKYSILRLSWKESYWTDSSFLRTMKLFLITPTVIVAHMGLLWKDKSFFCEWLQLTSKGYSSSIWSGGKLLIICTFELLDYGKCLPGLETSIAFIRFFYCRLPFFHYLFRFSSHMMKTSFLKGTP